MATVKQFEDLICWQRARELTKFIYDISKYRNFEMDRGLQDQIRRAAVSVMSNIVHPVRSQTPSASADPQADWTSNGAGGSCGEVKSQLYISYDSGYIDMPTFRNGLSLSDECSRLLQSFIQKAKQTSHTGIQYKKEKSKAELKQEELDIEFYENLQARDPALYEKSFESEHERLRQSLKKL